MAPFHVLKSASPLFWGLSLEPAGHQGCESEDLSLTDATLIDIYRASDTCKTSAMVYVRVS